VDKIIRILTDIRTVLNRRGRGGRRSGRHGGGGINRDRSKMQSFGGRKK
jgi:hypothetical protein